MTNRSLLYQRDNSLSFCFAAPNVVLDKVSRFGCSVCYIDKIAVVLTWWTWLVGNSIGVLGYN